MYVKFESVAGASAARVALHNRFFAGKPISATFLVRLRLQYCYQVTFLLPAVVGGLLGVLVLVFVLRDMWMNVRLLAWFLVCVPAVQTADEFKAKYGE